VRDLDDLFVQLPSCHGRQYIGDTFSCSLGLPLNATPKAARCSMRRSFAPSPTAMTC